MATPSRKTDRLEEELGCRLTSMQKARILQAAKIAGKKPADFMREALLRTAEQVLVDSPLEAFASFIGCATEPSALPARDHKQAYESSLEQKYDPARRRKIGHG